MGFSCHFPLSFKISLHLDATQAVLSVTENYSCTELELIALSTDSRGFLALKMNLLMLLPFLIQTPLTGFLLHIFWLFFVCWQLIIRIHFKMLVLTFRALRGRASQYVSDLLKPRSSSWALASLAQRLLLSWRGSGFSDSLYVVQTPLSLSKSSWNICIQIVFCLSCYMLYFYSLCVILKYFFFFFFLLSANSEISIFSLLQNTLQLLILLQKIQDFMRGWEEGWSMLLKCWLEHLAIWIHEICCASAIISYCREELP